MGRGSGTVDMERERPELQDKPQKVTQLPLGLCLWLVLLLNIYHLLLNHYLTQCHAFGHSGITEQI